MKRKLMLVIAILGLMLGLGQVANVGASTAIIVLDHAFAKNAEYASNGNVILINRTSTFTQDDQVIYAYAKAIFYSANITWNWYDPSGELYATYSYPAICVASPCDELDKLWITYDVAISPGLWRVDFLDGGSLIYSDYFSLTTVTTEYNYWNFTVVRSSPPQVNGSLRVVIHPSNLTWSSYKIYMPYAFNVTAHDYSTNQPLEVTTSPGDPILVNLGGPRAAGYSFVLKFDSMYNLLRDLGAGTYAFTWREYPWERINDIHPIPESFVVNLPNQVSLLDVVGYNSMGLTYNASGRAGKSLDLATNVIAQPVGWTVLYRDLSGAPIVSPSSSGSSGLNSGVLLPILPLTVGNLSVWAAVMSVFLLTASELVSPIYSRSRYGILINRKRLRMAALLLVAIFMITIAYQLSTQPAIIQH
jgi:hypothetical protein